MGFSFREYVDKKTRQARKQLNIVKKILEHEGFVIHDHIEEYDPYIYLENPNKQTTFEGIRIYKIGETLSFRVQNEEKTEPYGRAYAMNIEEMYKDLISDHVKESEAGHEIMKTIVKDFRNFFQQSAKAEKDLRHAQFQRDADPLGKIIISTSGSDYASTINSNPAY